MPLPRLALCLPRSARLPGRHRGTLPVAWGPCRLTRLLNQRRAP